MGLFHGHSDFKFLLRFYNCVYGEICMIVRVMSRQQESSYIHLPFGGAERRGILRAHFRSRNENFEIGPCVFSSSVFNAMKPPFVLLIATLPATAKHLTFFPSMSSSRPRSFVHATSASIKLSVPGSYVQIPTILNPADSSSSRQFRSVRSLDELLAITTISKPVLNQWAPRSGMTFSFMRSLLYPFCRLGKRLVRMEWAAGSGQLWRQEWT